MTTVVARGRALLRRLPAVSLPTQAFLLMAFSLSIVSGALIWHQGEAIKHHVLDDRFEAITRQLRVHHEYVAAQGFGGDRAAVVAYLHSEVDEMGVELAAIEVVVTDELGIIVASSGPADEIGTFEPAEEVHLILSGRTSPLMQPEKGDEDKDYAFAMPFAFPGFNGVLLVEEDILALNATIAAATWEAALPAILVLLLIAPLAALVTRRIMRRTQENELERAWQGRFQSLVQNASDVILIVDATGAINYAAPAMERVLGYAATGVLGLRFIDLVHPADHAIAHGALASSWDLAGRVTHSEYRIRHGDGHWVSAEVHSANLLHESSVGGTVLTIRDVSERKTLEAQLTHQALHDPLTDLANRALFNDRLSHALARARRGGSSLAVVLIDLDDFKSVNDTLGHHAGDSVLAQVGQRIRAAVRDADTAARLGGDEFAVLLEDVTADEVAPLSTRILKAFDAPFEIDGVWLTIGASIGVAYGDHGLIDTADFLRNADIAMYAAKDGGKGRLTVFEPGMRTAASEVVAATAELRRAIDEGQLEVHYQPIVDLSSGALRGMEALVRWRHPDRGEVMPAEFIPLAEKTGLIVPLGEFVLRRACLQARSWQLEDPDGRQLSVSVNLSGAQLGDPGLIDAVRAALEDSGLPPISLTLEITESVFVVDAEAATSVLRELKDLGVRLAIDDFGTGYSSLSYLRRFPVDVIKIDKSFVDGLVAKGPGHALAASIVRLAHSLQLETVAEGVEQPQQRALLAAMGCDEAQGYLFARPLDAEAATDFVRQAAKSEALAG